MFRMGWDDFWLEETSLELGLNVFMMSGNFREWTHCGQKHNGRGVTFIWLGNRVWR